MEGYLLVKTAYDDNFLSRIRFNLVSNSHRVIHRVMQHDMRIHKITKKVVVQKNLDKTNDKKSSMNCDGNFDLDVPFFPFIFKSMCVIA